jgi:hypothetical protein
MSVSQPGVPQPTLQSAWNLYVANWRPYVFVQLTLVGLAVVSMAISLVIALLTPLLTAGVAADARESVDSLVQSALNLPFSILYQVAAGLIGVLLSAFPALYFATGIHPDFAAGLRLLRERFPRFLLAGVLIALAAVIGLLLCLIPGLIVMVVTPIYIRRIFTTDQPIWPALLASFRDLFESPHGWGLAGYELLASVLVLISALFCLLPLFITIPLAAIFIQQYVASWGLGAAAVE